MPSKKGELWSETRGELVHNEYGWLSRWHGDTRDYCRWRGKCPEWVPLGVSGRQWECWTVTRWDMNNALCLTGPWPGDHTRPCHSSPHKEYCPQSLEITTWNQIHSYMSHTEIFIESKRFIWTGCISVEQNDWHKSLNKRLMNHSFFINFFWWSCRDRISKQSKCILEKAETQDESLRLLKIRTGPKILWVFNQLGPGNLDWDWSIIHLN